MTLTLELPPDVEQVLEATAHSSGRNVVDLATDVLRGYARQQSDEQEAQRQADIARRLAALDELEAFARSLPDNRAAAGLPPLDDTGISRADFYGYTEREDAQL